MSDQGKVDFRSVLETIIGKPSLTSEWTDEQWAQHDREVAAALVEKPATGKFLDELQALGWPRRALSCALENPETALSKFRGNRNGVIILAGPIGTGKTVAAAAWALESKSRTRFMRATTFAAFNRYSLEQRRELYSSPAMVLDDLGTEYNDTKGSFLVDLDELIDTYYGDDRTLIITTNLTRDAFRVRYGDRVADRLRECARWLAVTGTSMRKPVR